MMIFTTYVLDTLSSYLMKFTQFASINKLHVGDNIDHPGHSNIGCHEVKMAFQ